MPEKFDFSKIEDQKDFENLPQEEKDKIVGEAQEGTELIQGKTRGEKIEENKKITDTEDDEEAEVEDEKLIERKKIDIPEIGEIEYLEKNVVFPEKIIKENGGVKGYIRKTIRWEEFGRLLSINSEKIKLYKNNLLEFEKTKIEIDKELEASRGNSRIESEIKLDDAKSKAGLVLKKWEGMKLIIDQEHFLNIVEVLSNGEFPNKTYNHQMFGHSGRTIYKNKDFKAEKFIMQKIDFALDWTENYSRIRVLQYPQNKVIDNNLYQDDEEKILKYKKSKDPRYFFIGVHGISVSERGKFWHDLGPSPENIVFGFGSKNKVFKKYLEAIDKLIPDECIDKNNYIKTFLDKKETTGGVSHPSVPIVKNHPKISEPRWCFADYAAFSTSNGYNVLEIIT